MKKCGGIDFKAKRVFPIKSWTRADVYSYLITQGIEIPDGLGRKDQGGLDFHRDAINYLSDNDKKRIFRDFPFAGVQVFSEHP
jgi:3'-phosphoadenosine 5'-phosphosulfate sulfotransferase (PAPS reductase)/FAD synthetase